VQRQSLIAGSRTPTKSRGPLAPPLPAHLRTDLDSESDTKADTVSGRKRKIAAQASGRIVSWDSSIREVSCKKKAGPPGKSAGSFDIDGSNIDPSGQRRERIPVQGRYSPPANFSLADAHRAFLSTKWYDNTWGEVIGDSHVEKHLDDIEVFTHNAELNIDGPDQGNKNSDYAEAMSGPERQQWIEGMQKEIANLGDRLKCWEFF
jgi:hypothetical protein